MPPEDIIRIRHMIEAAEIALRFISGRTRTDIETNELLRFALVQAVQMMGDAASKVTPETRSAVSSVPWADIVFMRNRLVHGYFDINPDIVWETATKDIPDVLPLLRSLLKLC